MAGANAAGGRERFPGIVGTSIVGVFGMGFATTGLSAAAGARRGLLRRWPRASKPRPARAISSGTKTTVELVADRATRRLLGGIVIGEDGAAGTHQRDRHGAAGAPGLDEFEQLDLAYSPPFSPVWDPLLIAAQQVRKAF